jgi:hypothetical protein
MLDSIGVALVHHMGDIFRARRMVSQSDGCGHERLFRWSPSTNQRVGEDDPLEVVDGEKAGPDIYS